MNIQKIQSSSPPILAGVMLATTLVAGCTSVVLRSSTVSVTASIGEIVEQQIADNLALFHDHGIPFASQMLLSQGAITVQDNVTPTLKLPYTGSTSKEADLAASIQWQEAWTVTPVMNSKDLRRLEYAYECAAEACPDASTYPYESGAPTEPEVRAFSQTVNWLSFDGCSQHPTWRPLGRHHQQSVCVEPNTFARFALVILQATVNTQNANKQKGAVLAF